MTTDERLAADYAGTGITTGPHPMAYQRAALRRQGFLSAQELEGAQRRCARVRMAGCVISRQRPGTAKGFVFLSLEDETGIANIIIAPDVFEQNRLIVTRSRFLSDRAESCRIRMAWSTSRRRNSHRWFYLWIRKTAIWGECGDDLPYSSIWYHDRVDRRLPRSQNRDLGHPTSWRDYKIIRSQCQATQ